MHELSRRDQRQNETSLSIRSGIFRNKVANELTRKRSRGDAVRKCMNSLDKIGDKKQIYSSMDFESETKPLMNNSGKDHMEMRVCSV